jgi:hypothetical protein
MAPATKDVFIGYAEEDRSQAQPLVAAVQNEAISVGAAIFDGVSRGDDILRRAFETARCSVVLWSQAAASSLVGRELANHAIQAWWLNRLVLLTLDDTPLPSGLRDVPAIPLRGTSAADISEPLARIHKIIHENSTASRVSAKRVLTRKRAAYVFVALLVALLAAGTAAHLYQSRSRPLAQLKPALVLPPGLFTPRIYAGDATIALEREAARLYRFAADNGNSDAQRKLASFYEFGRGGLPKDNDQAALQTVR